MAIMWQHDLFSLSSLIFWWPYLSSQVLKNENIKQMKFMSETWNPTNEDQVVIFMKKDCFFIYKFGSCDLTYFKLIKLNYYFLPKSNIDLIPRCFF